MPECIRLPQAGAIPNRLTSPSRPHPAWGAIVNYYFFFRAPRWELLPGLGGGEPERSPDAAEAPLTDKTFKIWLQGGFCLHNAAMLGCDRLPTQVWKVWICLHTWNLIISLPFPPYIAVVLGKEYRRGKKKNQETKTRQCFEINPKGWDELKHD